MPADRIDDAWRAAILAARSWPDRLAWAAEQRPLPQQIDNGALEQWRDAVDPGDTGQFAQRLALAGLSEEQACVAVSPNMFPHNDVEPDWMPFLRSFLEACRDADAVGEADDEACLHWLAEREAGWPEGAALVPYAPLLWPGVRAAWDRLAGVHPDLVEHVGPGAVDGLSVSLLARLSELLAPTVAEVSSTGLTFGERLLQQVLDGPSEAPRAGFARTCRDLAAGGLDDVLLEYPVLPCLMGTTVRQWHGATVEMLARVVRHRDDLMTDLGVDTDLTGAAIGAGDGHNDGRAVAVLAFGRARVVYKPRDTRLERLWADLVDLLNDCLPGPGLRAARTVIDMDGPDAHYGFAEFIDHVPCRDSAELSRFYVNAGRTLALLHALCATDCHLENLIADGDQFVLIDAEALFETRSAEGEPDLGTVLQVGMLPSWLWLEGQRMAVDITALGCTPESTGRTSYRGWRAVNTDAMSRGVVAAPPAHPVSLPTAAGVTPDLPEHVEEIAQGFAEAYRGLTIARDAGLRERLVEAGDLSRRLIQRATYVYAVLLGEAREPAALRRSVARGMVLERLTRAYLVPEAERAWPLLIAEQQAMARMDVPLFEAALDGSRTWSRDVDLPGWPGVDALAAVQRRVARLNEVDLAWQSRLIRASVAAQHFRAGAARSVAPGAGVPQPSVASAAAATMADRCRVRVVDDAIRPAGRATWMTLGILPDGERVNVQSVGSGIYDGALGIALFLYESGESLLAEAAIGALIEELDAGDPGRARRQLLGVGPGLAGAGGYLRALRLVGHRGHLDADVVDRAVASIVRALPAVAADRALDHLNGVAGLVSPLAAEVTIRRLDTDDLERCRHLVEGAADHLVARQRPDGGWATLPGSGPLTGLAHGASGISVALVEAAACLGEERYLDAALRGLDYENRLFDAEAGNWPDLRESAQGGFMLGWCAGAPGIALARLRLLDLLPAHADADRWRADLEVAATTTVGAPLLERDHLCCGNLGRVAILRTLARGLERPDWAAAAERIMVDVLARADDGLPRSFLGRETVLAIPGLFTGLAGAALVLDPHAPPDWPTALLT